MLAGVIVLALIAAGFVLLLEAAERSERKVELASELQVPGSAQIRAAYDRAFRTRRWPVPTTDINDRRRPVDADVRRAA